MAKNKYTDIDLSKYDNGFQTTDAINQAQQKKVNAENALANLGSFNFNYGNQSAYDNAMNAILNRGEFSYANQSAYDKAMNDILNRKDFSYDLNGDMLYQQYKDNYKSQGNMAMMDTMGQAAAMTGGYGNSYAQTVGQQTYQGYLQNLNNMIPELYQMALDRYNSEGDRLATNYGILSSDRQNALNEYTTEGNRLASNFDLLNADRQNAFSEYSTTYNTNLNKLTSDRDYYSNDYNNVYNRDYNTWNDNRTYDTSQYWNEYNAGYQAEQDAIANSLAQAQLNESIRANRASEDAAKVNYYKALAELGDGIKPITRGSRGNTGNGGYSVLGSTYKTRDEAEEALAKYLDDLNLSETQITAIYQKFGM